MMKEAIFNDKTREMLIDTFSRESLVDLYNYVKDVCDSFEDQDILPEEVTYFLLATLDIVVTIRQTTTLHNTHFHFLKWKLRFFIESYHKWGKNQEVNTYYYIAPVMYILAKLLHQAGFIDNSNYILKYVFTDFSDYFFDHEYVEDNYKPANENVIKLIKVIDAYPEWYSSLLHLKHTIDFFMAKEEVATSSYIDISTIVDSITPANLQHIDIIKSFLSDVIDESKVDNDFKIKARKQLKEKVDQIKSTRLTADQVNFYEKVDNVHINNKNNDK